MSKRSRRLWKQLRINKYRYPIKMHLAFENKICREIVTFFVIVTIPTL